MKISRIINTAAVAVLSAAALCAVVALVSTPAHAKWPTISPIPDIWISMNESCPLIRFSIYDNETPAGDLVLTYRSSNKALIPEDDDHITLGGSGADRTLIITPIPGKWGFANITIFVTDNDGETAEEGLQVQVNRPPNM